MQRCISAGPAQVRHVRPGTGRVFSPIALGRSRATTRARYTNNQDSQYASAGGYDTGVECTKFDPYDSDLVTIAADHSVRVPAPGPGYDTLPQYGTGLGAYMMMPVDQFVLIDLPLGAYMARVDDSTFQLVIQEIAFFGFELRPIIKVRVTHSMYPRPSVILEAVEFRFDGSEIVRSLSDVSEVRGKTVLTWDEGDVDQAISSETSIRLYGKPPPPLNLIPRGVFESTANTIISTLLSAMQGPFVANIARDYQHWASDEAYRQDRANTQHAEYSDYPGSYNPGYPEPEYGGAPGSDPYSQGQYGGGQPYNGAQGDYYSQQGYRG